MTNIKTKTIAIGALLLGSIFTLSSWDIANPTEGPGSEWKAPASADNIKNPLKGNAAATASGKKLFKQLCAICHGNSGKGDGAAGMSLTPRPANFQAQKFTYQSDGAIYWKLNEGRPPMASYRTILKEDQKWQLINYLRTLKK